MQKLRKYLYPLSIFLILVSAITVSIIPDIYRLKIAPPHTTFPLVHNSQEDYFYYLSLMRQGKDGHLFVTSRMSPEIFPRMPVQMLFSIMGMSTRLTHLSLEITYFICRLLLGLILLLTSFFLIRHLFTSKKYQLMAFLIVCFGTGFWSVSRANNAFGIIQYLTFWTRLDPIMRTTYLPHHALSTICGLISLYFLAKGIEKGSFRQIAYASFFGFVSGYVYFATMVNILGGVAVSVLVVTLLILIQKGPRLKAEAAHIWYLIIYVCTSFLSLLIILSISKKIFPWSNYNNVSDQFTFFINWADYFKSLGPAFILTLLGLPLIISTGKLLPYLLFGWVVFPFIGIFYLFRIFHQYGDVYYLEATSYIPLGILAGYGLMLLDRITKRKIASWILMIILLVYSTPPIITSVNTEKQRLKPGYFNVFLPDDVKQGLSWLDKNSAEESVVISGGYMGVIIPAFTHNRMVNGHPKNTYLPADKTTDILTFFAAPDVATCAKILAKHHVSYVFYSYDTAVPGDKFLENMGVSKVFDSPVTKIYKTNL